MSTLIPPSSFERVTGSLPTELVLTGVALASGFPLAALLPILAKSLAAGRQQRRVEETLKQMDGQLQLYQQQLAALTDAQYKLINEAILTLFQTTNEEKMALLRNAVHNGLMAKDLRSQEAVFLGRVIRDISHEEARFLINNFRYKQIFLNENAPNDESEQTLVVKPNTTDGNAVLGLNSLGLLTAADATWSSIGKMVFSPIAAKLIALLKNPDV